MIVFIRYTSVSPSGSVLVWNEAYNSLYDIYSAQGWVSWEGQAIPPEQPFHLHTVVAFVDAEFVMLLGACWLLKPGLTVQKAQLGGQTRVVLTLLESAHNLIDALGGVLSVAWLYREDFHEIVCRIVVGRTIIAQAWLNVNKKPQYIFQLENDRYQLDR